MSKKTQNYVYTTISMSRVTWLKQVYCFSKMWKNIKLTNPKCLTGRVMKNWNNFQHFFSMVPLLAFVLYKEDIFLTHCCIFILSLFSKLLTCCIVGAEVVRQCTVCNFRFIYTRWSHTQHTQHTHTKYFALLSVQANRSVQLNVRRWIEAAHNWLWLSEIHTRTETHVEMRIFLTQNQRQFFSVLFKEPWR